MNSSAILKDTTNVFQTFFKMNSYLTFKEKEHH